MGVKDKKIEKVYSSYVSEYHLEMILLPFINSKIEEKEKILAYCSMQTVLDEGDILNVAVSPDRQREGIGYFLVDSMLKMAEMIGIHIVHLEVREGNGTARRLYERLGFKEDGLRKNYYTDPTENAVLMTKMQE